LGNLNFEVSELKSELRARDTTISEANEQIARLESELAATQSRSQPQPTPTPTIELPEPADLLNQLKGKRKKSKADLADIEKILEILERENDE